MFNKTFAVIFAVALLILTTGCSTTALSAGGNPNSYARGQTFTPGKVFEGVVVQSRDVKIQGGAMTKTIGTGAGGLIGAVLAAKAGTYVQIAAGAVGAITGGLISTVASETNGSEIVVKIPGSQTPLVLVHEMTGSDPVPAAGDRVYVLVNGSEARIVPLK